MIILCLLFMYLRTSDHLASTIALNKGLRSTSWSASGSLASFMRSATGQHRLVTLTQQLQLLSTGITSLVMTFRGSPVPPPGPPLMPTPSTAPGPEPRLLPPENYLNQEPAAPS